MRILLPAKLRGMLGRAEEMQSCVTKPVPLDEECSKPSTSHDCFITLHMLSGTILQCSLLHIMNSLHF